MTTPRPLRPTKVVEVHLPRTPLVAVVSQVRFPAILTIDRDDSMIPFQELLRSAYPHLTKDNLYQVNVSDNQEPDIRKTQVWRLAEGTGDSGWRVSLGQDFVSLETRRYDSRRDFLDRMRRVLEAVATVFSPASATRLGLRYIDRLTGQAVASIDKLIHKNVLGIAGEGQHDSTIDIDKSIVRMMTRAQFLATDDHILESRWGILSPNETMDPEMLPPINTQSWVLDMDMFTTQSCAFAVPDLLDKAAGFAECMYWLFREMVTDDFLKYYGGQV